MTTLTANPRPRLGFPLIAGIALILGGLLLGLENAGLSVPDTVFRLWPLLLMLLGAARLHARGWLSTGGHFLLFLGMIFLGLQFAPETAPRFLGPVSLLWLGVIISLRALRPTSTATAQPAAPPADE
jgi:hypothetical protein